MTKRKKGKTRATGKAKRRVPFTAPKDAATKAIIAHNASKSPLLRVPLEIRNGIWAAVLGDQLIHLEYRQTQNNAISWRHIVCEHDCPESQEVENQRAQSRPQTIVNGGSENAGERLHNRCKHSLNYDEYRADHQQLNHRSMTLTALQTCRQAYNEANLVLWSTNTFSFRDAVSLEQFMVARTPYQKRSLRSLRLQMDRLWEFFSPWNKAIGMVKSLAGLRSLRLQINHNSMIPAFYRKLEARGDKIKLYQRIYLPFVREIATLSLTNVEVFVGDNLPQHLAGNWTIDDRVEYAEGIREMLLHPKGTEIYAQSQEKVKEHR